MMPIVLRALRIKLRRVAPYKQNALSVGNSKEAAYKLQMIATWQYKREKITIDVC